MATSKPTNINEYIASFPAHTQLALKEIRNTIRKAAPDAEEIIKYDMPTFMLNGNLIYFAAFKNHIGLYAVPTGVPAFEKSFSPYKTGKGSIQFPLDKPMPLNLISRIVKFNIKRNKEKK
ncbi:MAG: DUF1801 domain-containing protein [Agriterribacter sp.]